MEKKKGWWRREMEEEYGAGWRKTTMVEYKEGGGWRRIEKDNIGGVGWRRWWMEEGEDRGEGG